MPRDEQEFLTYLARHFRLVDSVCAQLKGFESDSELHAFLEANTDEAQSVSHHSKRLKDVGVLIEGATGWTAPPFLTTFLRQLHERHLLASPKVVQGWIEELQNYSQRLAESIHQSANAISSVNEEHLVDLAENIQYTIVKIVDIVRDNCECIAQEVQTYRCTEDVARIKSRLARLVDLYKSYLDPVIDLVNINGSFYEVGKTISNQCEQIASGELAFSAATRSQFESLRVLVVWLRTAVLKQAEEAKRELAPLCSAAAQEQKISTGVNRALEFARLGQFSSLEIPRLLKIVDQKNGPMFSDTATERYLEDVSSYSEEPPARVIIETPKQLPVPVTADQLIEKLELEAGTDDLLAWILSTNEDVELELAMQLFLNAIRKRSDSASPTDETKTYSRNQYETEAVRWIWRNKNGASDERVSPKTRRSVSTA